MDVIDRLNLCLKIIRGKGIQVRFEDLEGMSSGLCEVKQEPILMVDFALTSKEQVEILERVVEKLSADSKSRPRVA